jgi:hypothetical protein
LTHLLSLLRQSVSEIRVLNTVLRTRYYTWYVFFVFQYDSADQYEHWYNFSVSWYDSRVRIRLDHLEFDQSYSDTTHVLSIRRTGVSWYASLEGLEPGALH